MADSPPEWPRTTCEDCRAPIVWALTTNLKRMPIDADPVDPVTGGGNITLTGGPGTPRATVHGNPAGLFGARWVYRTHMQTCPFAGRRKRAGRRREHA